MTTYESLDGSIDPSAPEEAYTPIQTPQPDYDYESLDPSIGPSIPDEAYTSIQRRENDHEYQNTDAVTPVNMAY